MYQMVSNIWNFKGYTKEIVDTKMFVCYKDLSKKLGTIMVVIMGLFYRSLSREGDNQKCGFQFS